MTVPVYKRSPNKLQALKDTMTMAIYTIQMCENSHIFPKKSRWNICSRIMDCCIDSIVKIKQANKLRNNTEEQCKKRIELQNKVIMNFTALWSLMELAYNVYSIPSEKVGYWSELMLVADEKVAAWHKSDMEKLKTL